MSKVYQFGFSAAEKEEHPETNITLPSREFRNAIEGFMIL
jgi:hypothetical protein